MTVNADFPPRRGWGNPHLQTVRSRVVPMRYSLAGLGTSRELVVDLADGSGDRLAVALTEPSAPTGPAVLVIHGLGGTAESDYVVAMAQGLLQAGFPVARVDLRGAGRSAATSSRLYHGGRTEDVRAVLRHLHAELDRELCVVGFSLGGNATLKLLGEPLGDLPVVAGASVSAPLDLAVGAQHLQGVMFGAYQSFLLRRLQSETLRPGARYTPEERAAVRASRTLVDFDDAVTAPRNGWRDAAEYYEVNSSVNFLPRIAVPTLVIHAADDPMVPIGPYEAVDWDLLEPTVTRRITPHGGHVGFHVQGLDLPWYVGQITDFLRPLQG